MSWAVSLVKLSTYEVELLQKRLGEIAARRLAAEERLARLAGEAEAEAQHAAEDAESGWYKSGYLDGLRRRRAAIRLEIERLAAEEAGARDALAGAFEEQKKYENVAENIRLGRLKEAARRETAALDEMGLRRAAAARR